MEDVFSRLRPLMEREGRALLNARPTMEPGAYIVLCKVGAGDHVEYVTWRVGPVGMGTYWGHYHGEDRNAASKDFWERT